MESSALTGSPVTHRRPISNKSNPMEENIKANQDDSTASNSSDQQPPLKKSSTPLSTTSLVNQSCPERKISREKALAMSPIDATPMDKLLAKLSEQQSRLNKRSDVFKARGEYSDPDHMPASNSMPITPATENFGTVSVSHRPTSTNSSDGKSNEDEVLRLKLELARAQNKINLLEEGSQGRRNSPFQADFAHSSSPFDPNMLRALDGNHPLGNPPTMTNSWPAYDDSRSDTSDALSVTGFNRARNAWQGTKSMQLQNNFFTNPDTPNVGHTSTGRHGMQAFTDSGMSYNGPPVAEQYRNDRLTPDFDTNARVTSSRRGGRLDGNRFPPFNFNSQSAYGNGYNNYNSAMFDGPSPANSSMSGQYPMGMAPYSGHQPSPIGTPLSPLATEFTSAGGSWKSENLGVEGPTYLPTTEPLNYRRLLDRNVNCNWKYIVDKIVCNNDQQASIFLQQKLKVGTPDQKYEIVEAIVLQAHPLMVNRFGNFLVQRCFEHGTPEQVIKIAEAIRGNTLSLSMDPFGCHVIQKAFDSVPEDYKAVMVHELLRRIPETVIHRYACHVWQKLFELRWSESPPQIMKYVNEALRGMWHEVALGETGSLVVQNIFENCLEEDKRPCIEEVLANIDIVAHGQFGNWCIQHICEHGSPADRSRAIDHVIRYAAEYSMDQYASKVVEKCLKIGGGDFLGRYLDRVCEGRVDRPRIPLIDIASDQYGNYLIQWILTHANPQHRDIVAAHIRKHMVSLRGSKFGSRVGMLCTNPAVATRPGPGISSLNRMPGPRYGRSYQ
ncbi:armadillo-type protein [Xylariales sp. PMI_506]|nr:armadillo-type protein [Xylariales sp. PMI_506]